jgi:hypothetical protein
MAICNTDEMSGSAALMATCCNPQMAHIITMAAAALLSMLFLAFIVAPAYRAV